MIGSLVASLLVGSHRLARWFGIGVALWGLPIALIPAFPWEATVLIMPACVGIGNALVDVGLFTLIARLAPDAVLARVFGILESLISLAVGLGAVVASLLINLTGLRIALVAVGALCPISGGGGMAPSETPGPLYRRTGQRDHCSTAYPCCSHYRYLPSNSWPAVWNQSTCLPAGRYFARVIRPTAST